MGGECLERGIGKFLGWGAYLMEISGFEEISWLKWCLYGSLHLQNKILQIVHVRSVHFAVYEFYLKKNEFYLSVKKKYLKIMSLSSWVPRSSRDLRRGTSLSWGTPAAISLSEQYRILPSLLLSPFLPNEVCLWGWLSKAMWCCVEPWVWASAPWFTGCVTLGKEVTSLFLFLFCFFP